jgi:asparagine synthase (glutamine-hydrolysing)
MCGISGIAGRSDPTLIQRMTDLLAHRGPDGEGFHHGPGVSLGHRRLVVLDREGGAQPMHDRTGRYSLVHNGEIYNYRDLRETLRAEGYGFRTQCDTEVLLAALMHWGEGALDRLQGMFAFALWDQAEERLLLARDPLGVKPLYYSGRGDQLYFASEMKSLLCCPDVSRAFDPEALEDYLSFLYTVPPRTIFRDIRQLPAGHCATWCRGVWTERPYWHWPLEVRQDSEAVWLERLEAQLEESMPHYGEADVPVGALLSGGLDSACIVEQLARQSAPQTFCIGFGAEGGGLDETRAARETAQHLGTRHREIRAEADVARLLPEVVRHFDEPFGNPTALLAYVLFREVRKHITVVLSGDGGDEVFGGYRRYQGTALSAGLGWVPSAFWRGVAPLAKLLPAGLDSHAIARRLRGFVTAQGLDPVARYAAWTAYHDRASLDVLYAPDHRRILADRDPLEHLRVLAKQSVGLGPVNQAMYLDLNCFLPNNVLRYGDRMSMAHGLETRVPLADPVLASTFLAMPAQLKVSRGVSKVLLRRHLRGKVPDGVVSRAKQGLNPPMGAWLRGPLRPMLEDHLSCTRVAQRGYLEPVTVARLREEHLVGRRDHTWRLWALIVFEEWHRAYLD